MAGRTRGAASPAPDLPTAVELALRYLGARPRSRWEVRRRLERAAAPEAVINAALDRLAELGYLDDRAFARWWAEQRDRHAPRGQRLLEAELRQRGVPREVLSELRAEPPAGLDEVRAANELERAQIALERHLRGRPLPTEARALQRLGMFLMRRGFDPETVRSVLRTAGAGNDDGKS